MKFSELLEIRNGKNQRQVENPKSKYPIYGSGGVMGWADDYICPAHTVIIGRKGSINNPMYVETPFWNVDTAFGLIPNTSIILPKYLDYFCRSFDFERLNTTVTIPSLTKANPLQIEMDVPALEEQRAVVDTLDVIENILSLLQKQMECLKKLVKSRFIEMFGDLAFNPMHWQEMTLVEACVDKDDIKCDPFGTQLGKHEYHRDGVPLWGIPQINAAFAIPPTDFLSVEKAEQLSSYSLLPGDIAMSRKGNVGKCAIYPEGSPKGIIHSDVLRIRVDTEICNPVFLMCQLHFSREVGTQIDTVSSGAIMAGINVTKLKKIMVYVPPIALQNQFADFVALADKSKLLLQKMMEKQKTLRAKWMQEYFGCVKV